MVARTWKPGFGSQDFESQDLVPKIIRKIWCLHENQIWEKNNDSRKRFVDIGLVNVAVAAARVTDIPSRCSNKVGLKRRCL